jgi:hypothetical protein
LLPLRIAHVVAAPLGIPLTRPAIRYCRLRHMDATLITGVVGVFGIVGSVGSAIFAQRYARGTTKLQIDAAIAGVTTQIAAGAETERQRDVRALHDLRVARLRAAYQQALSDPQLWQG